MKFLQTLITTGMIGLSSVAIAEPTYSGSLIIGGGNPDFKGVDADSDIYFEFLGRAKFENGFAVDLSYVDFGENSVDEAIFKSTIEVNGFSLQGAYFYDITEKFDIYARAGFYMWNSEVKTKSLDSSFIITDSKSDDNGTDITYGIGADYHLNEKISLGGVLQNYIIDDGSMLAAGVSASYSF